MNIISSPSDLSSDAVLQAVESPLQRHPANPVLTASDVPYDCTLLFNAGVARFNGRYVMVFRNDQGRWGDPQFDGTNLGLAWSDDGIDWQVQPQPCITWEHACDLIEPFMPHLDSRRELKRFYDPRITVMGDKAYLCFAVDTLHGIHGGIAVTEDFKTFNVLSISPPDNRNMVLFPELIDGQYVRLERPMPVYSRDGKDRFDIWCSRSPDLRYWGDSRLVLATEQVPFTNDKIGPAAPPIRTNQGWLTTFHAVSRDQTRGKNGWEDAWQKIYYAGLMLLDLRDPSRVIAAARTPLLAPESEHERNGFRNDVIFPGGMILSDDNQVYIYYGAADTVECLATTLVNELVEFCLKNNVCQ